MVTSCYLRWTKSHLYKASDPKPHGALSFQIAYNVCRLGMGLAWFQVVILGGLSPTRIRPRTRGLKASLCLKLVVHGWVSAFQVGWLFCRRPQIRALLALGFAV